MHVTEKCKGRKEEKGHVIRVIAEKNSYNYCFIIMSKFVFHFFFTIIIPTDYKPLFLTVD